MARAEPGHEVAGKGQRAPHDQQQAGELVDPGLPDPANDILDIAQRGGSFPAFDAHDDPLPAFATSFAMMEMALGALTMPM